MSPSSEESRRSDTAHLFIRVAETLEHTAQLAHVHAERHRSGGRSEALELERSQRAGKAAERARDLASRLQ